MAPYDQDDLRIEAIQDDSASMGLSDKDSVHIIDEMTVLGLSNEEVEFYNDFSAEERKKLTKKVCAEWRAENCELHSSREMINNSDPDRCSPRANAGHAVSVRPLGQSQYRKRKD